MVDHNTNVGVFDAGAVLHVTGTVVSDTQPDQDRPTGRGLSAQPQEGLGTPAEVTLDSSVIEHNRGGGLFVAGSAGAGTRTVIRDPVAALPGGAARGVALQGGPLTGAASAATIDHSLVDGSRGIGLFCSGSSLDMTGSVVRGTTPTDAGVAGRGLALQAWEGIPSVVSIAGSVVTDNTEFGVYIWGAQVDLEDTTIAATAATTDGAQELFGDGIAIQSSDAFGQVSLSSSHLIDNERAGILYFGGTLSLGATQVACNAIDLVDGSAGALVFDNAGGNTCGCPAGAGECKWQSTTVAAPAPLEPDPTDEER